MANCRILKNIGIDNCSGNKGGIYTEVIFASRTELNPKKDEKSVPTTGYEKVSDEVYQNGYVVLTTPSEAFYIKFRKNSSGLTSEGTFDEANGVYFFTNNLNLVIAKQGIQARMALQALALADDLAILVRDGNNMVHFLGLDDTVSATAMTAQTGTANTDGNNYTVTLTDTSNELPFFVDETTWNTLKNLADPPTSGSGQ